MNPELGYEGSHIQKINGYYYIFLVHSLRDRWMRTEACFYSDSLEGEFTGGDVLCDDRGYCGQGVAQGGIVDTPDGKWYAMLFQDSGAVGRIPILLPVTWKDHFPFFGQNGHVPEEIEVHSTRPGYIYQPLVGSDDFCNGLLPRWQFNHDPDPRYYHLDALQGTYTITTREVCTELTQAVNTLTQRMSYPSCAAEVTVDASALKEGDVAGLCALQSCYAAVGITKHHGKYEVLMLDKKEDGILCDWKFMLNHYTVLKDFNTDSTATNKETGCYPSETCISCTSNWIILLVAGLVCSAMRQRKQEEVPASGILSIMMLMKSHKDRTGGHV